MPARIERDPEFASDLRRQLSYLVERDELEWIITLREDLDEAEDLLASFPAAGREVRLGRRAPVRRLRLRRAPYVIWYQLSATRMRVTLVRLFHVRQRRPDQSGLASRLKP